MKICIVAQFPPPITGLSKAVETLYNSSISEKYNFKKINITNNFRFPLTVYEILKSNADVFYFTICQSVGGNIRDLFILFLIKKLKRKKCVIHLHGANFRNLVDNIMPKWQRKLNYYFLKEIDGAIVLSKSLKNIFEGMVIEDRIYVVSNGVDNEYLITDEEFGKKLRQSKEKRIKHFLFISNFIPSKGYKYVLEMAKKEKQKCDKGGEQEYYFDFAGLFFEKTEQDFFNSYIVQNELNDYVKYHGAIYGDRKRLLLYSSDFLILLTTYPIEGQPISILEGMGNGLVIITTNHAGIPDIVQDGINGIVVDKNNIQIDEIFEKIKKIDMYSVAKNNRMVICNQFKQNDYISRMESVFEKM